MELVKISGLVDHYNEHQAENPGGFGILDFLSLHYFDPGHDEPGSHEHLPFHNPASFSNVVFIAGFHHFIVKPLALKVQKRIPFQNTSIYNTFQSNIWQPPRFW